MNRRLFTLDQVLDALEDLGVSFRVHGDSSEPVLGFASLRGRERSGIFFLEGAAFEPALIQAGIVLCRRPLDRDGVASILVDRPQLAFYKLMRQLYRDEAPGAVHSTAVVDPGASVDPTAVIGPYCVIGNASIGARVRLTSHVVVADGSVLEEDVVAEAHTCIGATGMAWVWDPETGDRVRQPQVGGVRVGAGCFLGSDVGIVRGSVNEVTELGAESVVAPGSKIGHGCRIGRHAHFANNVSLGGNVDLGDRVFLGSGAVVRPRVSIADDTVIAAGAVVVKDVVEPGMVVMGVPATPTARRGDLSGVPESLKGDRE